MDISLRAATDADIPFLIQLREITMTEHLAAVGAPTSHDEYSKRVHYHFDGAQLIEAEGKVVGLFKTKFLVDKNQWYLVQIQVHPDYQNHKIGSRLIKQLLSRAIDQGASVYLSVLKSNPAQHLYRHLGFEKIGETQFEYEMLFNG
jgi:ribosomal protein S18 acetylase RimI-like enzyme